MDLPFTAQQFFAVFGQYNLAVWPMQIVLAALALAAIGALVLAWPWSGVAIAASLALLWAWLGIGYHLAWFTRINPLAWGFAALSLAGALVFAWHGLARRTLRFGAVRRPRAIVGIALLVYALLAYPVWSHLGGHRYPEMPTFGLPCPTTMFTFGMLAFLLPPYPRGVLVVPILWSAVGTQAAFLLEVPQDLGLGFAGIAGLVWLRRPPR